jgi:hypothetical protein
MLKKHFIKNQFWVWTGVETIMAGLAFFLGYLELNEHLPITVRLFESNGYSVFLIVLGTLLIVNVLWDFYWHYIRLVLVTLTAGVWFTLALSISLSDLTFTAPRVTLLSMFCWVVFVKCCITLWLEPSYKLKGGHSNE